MARGVMLYALSCFLLIGLGVGVLVTLYHGDADRRAILASALLGLVVQVVTFSVARLLAQANANNLFIGWGLGALVCMLVLVVYGFVCRATGLPTSAALVSLAMFFFTTELIEAPFLTL